MDVVVGIETDRRAWVASLIAAGYEVYAINPLKAARYRQRHSTSGAKSDAADAHLLAEIVRLDRDNHEPVAGDSALAAGIKLTARAHQGLIWERTRHVPRLRMYVARGWLRATRVMQSLLGQRGHLERRIDSIWTIRMWPLARERHHTIQSIGPVPSQPGRCPAALT